MKRFYNLFTALAVAATLSLAGPSYAGGLDLATKNTKNFETFSGAAATGDKAVLFDASDDKWKTIEVTDLPYSGGTFTGAVDFDDGSGASPTVTFTDGTDETAVLQKLDAGTLDVTTDAGDGLRVMVGNLFIGNGTPGETINGEDLYVEGISEFDGVATFDGVVNFDSTVDFDGAANFDAAVTLTGDLSGDGGDQLFGFLQDQVASTTVAITAAQCGKTFVSNSADVMDLPEASTVLGCRLTFVCGTADDFDVNPADGTDQISVVNSVAAGTGAAITPSAGDAIRCTDAGSSIVLEAVGANLWAAIGVGNGAWTDVN